MNFVTKIEKRVDNYFAATEFELNVQNVKIIS